MIGQARCGVSKGTPLERWPVIEMTWDVWSSLYPSTLVLAGDQAARQAVQRVEESLSEADPQQVEKHLSLLVRVETMIEKVMSKVE